MKVEMIESFEVTGFKVRTKNIDEYNIATAKIAGLWGKFGAELGPLLTEKSKVYGVYTNYESDVNGMYDVITGADTLIDSDLSGLNTVKVPAGKYLVFSDQGEFESVCMKLWQGIGEYFGSEKCEHERIYATDFEAYTDCIMEGEIMKGKVDIYMAIK